MDALLAFWGKARAAHDAACPVHPCVYHSLDVSAVGETLLETRPDLVAGFADVFGWKHAPARVFLTFLLSLHDIGKISSAFQAQVPEHWPTKALGPFRSAAATKSRHDAMGLYLLANVVPDEDIPALANLTKPRLRKALLTPLVGHHGKPVTKPKRGEAADERCEPYVRLFCRTMNEVFAPEPLPIVSTRALCHASWRLAGLAVLADWIGSNQEWFAYERPELDPVAYYHEIARPRAKDALGRAGLPPARPSLVTGFRALTAKNDDPSPVQAWAEREPLPDGPCLVLIEDMTGSGKTEAALIFAHRMMVEGRARGIYIALPTMATANSMFARLSENYRRLFAPGETPSLALAHSASRLHKGFSESIRSSVNAAFAADSEDKANRVGDDAGAACAAWLADSRRKVFLADVGVGTIDQAFLAVLPAKHQSLRLFGLADRVLIIDEAHAYDPYMGEELEGLLRFQAALGGSAIVLSATLPMNRRRQLVEAYAEGLGMEAPALEKRDYPLTTVLGGGIKNAETKHQTRPDLPRTLAVMRLADEPAALNSVQSAAAAGAAAVWIRNTVDDVFMTADALRANGLEVSIFHARFAMGDRLVVEDRIVSRFGRRGSADARRGILIATQVVEQSLDLDFDAMVSDLAPIDLLLQRAGRLWRHMERARPLPRPVLAVVSPEPVDNAGARWFQDAFPRAACVYKDHALLWLTARHLFAREAWRIPEDVRALMEAVDDGLTQGEFPKGLERNFNEALGNAQAARSVATSNLLRLNEGYVGDHDGWNVDVRVPTRIGEEMTILRLARVEDDRLLPWCEDSDPYRAWALSEVSVRKNRAQGSAPLPQALKAAAGHAQRLWTRYDEGKLLVPLTEEAPGRWSGQVRDSEGADRHFTYTRKEGLRWSSQDVP